jgi:hypothetical protein
MAQTFTPLVPAASSAALPGATPGNSRLQRLGNQGPKAAAFHPLELKLAAAPTPPPPSSPPPAIKPGTTTASASESQSTSLHSPATPTLEVVQDGDRITRIRVRCSCGEWIELDCES